MCWTDKIAMSNVIKLKNELDISTAISTGTYYGADTELYANYFDEVFSMDINPKYMKVAKEKLRDFPNVHLRLMNSWDFIDEFCEKYELAKRDDIVYFYLDAHFYDEKLPPADKWVVAKELKALYDFKNCVIVIHDFDCNGLGHLVYDREHLNWNVVGKYLKMVNPYFYYYCNTKEMCDIVNGETINKLPILVDEYILDDVRYANSSDEKRYRGMLYAVPKKLNLMKYKLVEFKHD